MIGCGAGRTASGPGVPPKDPHASRHALRELPRRLGRLPQVGGLHISTVEGLVDAVELAAFVRQVKTRHLVRRRGRAGGDGRPVRGRDRGHRTQAVLRPHAVLDKLGDVGETPALHVPLNGLRERAVHSDHDAPRRSLHGKVTSGNLRLSQRREVGWRAEANLQSGFCPALQGGNRQGVHPLHSSERPMELHALRARPLPAVAPSPEASCAEGEGDGG